MPIDLINEEEEDVIDNLTNSLPVNEQNAETSDNNMTIAEYKDGSHFSSPYVLNVDQPYNNARSNQGENHGFREQIHQHLDTVQGDLESLKELLSGDNYSLDTNALLGVST